MDVWGYSTFSKVFYRLIIAVDKKMYEVAEGCLTTQSSFSRMKMGCMENIAYLRHCATDFLQSFTTSFGKQWHKIKNYWTEWPCIIDHGYRIGNVLQFFLYLGFPWLNLNKTSLLYTCFRSLSTLMIIVAPRHEAAINFSFWDQQFGERSFSVSGRSYWNYLSDFVVLAPSIETLKMRFKTKIDDWRPSWISTSKEIYRFSP